MRLNLAFDDASFDCARAERVLIHLRDARKGLEEMIRVVRSGGRVVVSELDLATVYFDSPLVELTRSITTSIVDAMLQSSCWPFTGASDAPGGTATRQESGNRNQCPV